MIKGKNMKRTLDQIGKTWYDFDFQLERTVYGYLCCCRLKRKAQKNLDKKLKFKLYRQWKNYIWNKYEKYSKEDLIEFSRYLNQRIRNNRPSHEYWNILATVVLTVMITRLFESIISTPMDFTGISIRDRIIISLVVGGLIVFLLIYLVCETFLPIFEDSLEENFLRDYKEIIDEIIKEEFKR